MNEPPVNFRGGLLYFPGLVWDEECLKGYARPTQECKAEHSEWSGAKDRARERLQGTAPCTWRKFQHLSVCHGN